MKQVLRYVLWVLLLGNCWLLKGITLAYFEPAEDNPNEYKLTITVKNIGSKSGAVMIAVYEEPSNFLSETSFKQLSAKVDGSNSVTTSIELPEGVYAIALFHDENSNGYMDRNFFKIPTEPYGFSNRAKAVLSPPDWKDAIFKLNQDRTEIIVLDE